MIVAKQVYIVSQFCEALHSSFFSKHTPAARTKKGKAGKTYSDTFYIWISASRRSPTFIKSFQVNIKKEKVHGNVISITDK